MPDDLFSDPLLDDAFADLRAAPGLAPRAGTGDLRRRARRRTRAQVTTGGALVLAGLGVVVGVAQGATAPTDSELVPAAPTATSPSRLPPPAVVVPPSSVTPAPGATGTTTVRPSTPPPTRRATPSRPPSSASSTGRPSPTTTGASPTTPPASPPTTPPPTSRPSLPSGTHDVRVVAQGADGAGRYLVVDLGTLGLGEPEEPGVDSTRPVTFDSGSVDETIRVDLADSAVLTFNHAIADGSYGPGTWAELVTEISMREDALLAEVTVDAQGRLTALTEPYRA